MTFNEINKDNDCKCVKDASENTKDLFTRKLRKDQLVDDDFKSYWERGRYGESSDCKNICARKGISIDMVRNNNEEEIMEKYRRTFKITPQRQKFYCKFRFKEDAGKMKSTPSHHNRWHHTFYKCDQFSIDRVEIIEISVIP